VNEEVLAHWRAVAPKKSRRMKWAKHVARVGERSVVYRVLGRKTEENRPLGRPRRIWENNNQMKWDVGVWNVSTWRRIGTGGWNL